MKDSQITKLENLHKEYISKIELMTFYRRAEILGVLIWGTIIIFGITWFLRKEYVFLLIALIIGVGQEIAGILIERRRK